VSTVVPRINGPVTSFQHSFIVSELGAAMIWGYDVPRQAGQVIDRVAHPSVREQLREAIRSLGLSA
jgi:acyl-CoA hydrolase